MASENEQSGHITTAPTDVHIESRKLSIDDDISEDKKKKKKQKRIDDLKAFANFLYNPRKRTVLGRDALNWAKLSAFYTVFYFFLGCFFVALVYVFATILDRTEPRYSNTRSTMAVRSPYAVVGMGFRPQPDLKTSLIEITNDPDQQQRLASSLRLFRDVFLLQETAAPTEKCSVDNPASSLEPDTACAFDWFHIVENQNHPCSDDNMYGLKNEQPCVLVKLNKVYGWKPIDGPLPHNIQNIQGVHNNKILTNADVYVTCDGSNVADSDVLKNITYYSLGDPSGSSKYGVIPNYYFPYRNARNHVQPFVLVQFNKLPLNRLVSVTCRAWAPGIEHNTKGMRGMVGFQLYRKHTHAKPVDDKQDDHNDH